MLIISKHEDNLGNENLEDLLAVCPTCYKRYHSGIGEKDNTKKKAVVVKKTVVTHKDMYTGKRRGDGSSIILEERMEEDIIF